MKASHTLTPPRRGRPRDPECDRAILDAARTVFAKKGYTGASMEQIARTARVGKDTLYRRWNSKEQLIEQLLRVVSEENVPIPAEEDPRFALFLFLQDIVRLNTKSDFGALIAGIVGESARSPDLADAFHRFWHDRRLIAGDLVRRIVGPAVKPDEIDRLLDRLVGTIYYRLLLTGAPLDDEHLWDLVTEVPWPTGDGPQPD